MRKGRINIRAVYLLADRILPLPILPFLPYGNYFPYSIWVRPIFRVGGLEVALSSWIQKATIWSTIYAGKMPVAMYPNIERPSNSLFPRRLVAKRKLATCIHARRPNRWSMAPYRGTAIRHR